MKDLIETTLQELIPPSTSKLFEAALYSLEGGKRLRPLLTLAVADTFNQPIETALYPACAVELIHTYSLIHDDLPCMDDDDIRRDKPTLHKAYSESRAILTGDFLLTYAFEVLAKAPQLSPNQKNALILTLAKRAGSEGMIGGQVLDMEENSHEHFIEMRLKKTGALISAALEFGGIIAHQEDLTILQTIGRDLGLAFQIVDDILDEDGAVRMLGLTSAQKMAEDLYHSALEHIQTLPGGAPLLTTLANGMIYRTV